MPNQTKSGANNSRIKKISLSSEKCVITLSLIAFRSVNFFSLFFKRIHEEKLEQVVGHLCRALSENEAKLAVTEAFIKTTDDVSAELPLYIFPIAFISNYSFIHNDNLLKSSLTRLTE